MVLAYLRLCQILLEQAELVAYPVSHEQFIFVLGRGMHGDGLPPKGTEWLTILFVRTAIVQRHWRKDARQHQLGRHERAVKIGGPCVRVARAERRASSG